MHFKQISEPKLAHHAYLVGCQQTGTAIIVDPLRDIDRYINVATRDGMTIVAATETHIHADYLSGLRQFAESGVKVYASDEGDEKWKYEWLQDSSYDHELLKDGHVIRVGQITLTVKSTPGHTPEHVVFLITDTARDPQHPVGVITGDFVFVGDVGRPDLLETAAGQAGMMVPSASTLFDSLQKFKELSPNMMLWPGHGAGSACGKSLGAAPVSTVGYELASNPAIQAADDRDRFINHILEGQPEPPPYFARMKLLNRTGPNVLADIPRPQSPKLAELDNILNQQGTVIIDARPWFDFLAGHLPGALFIPDFSAVSTLVGSYVDPDATVVLVSHDTGVDEFVRHSIRVGVDNIRFHLTPAHIHEYAAAGGTLSTLEEIGMSELAGKLDVPEVHLLDVRRSAELIASGKIGDAQNIAHTQLQSRYEELPENRSIYVYCQNGNRSRYAATYLVAQGLDVTHVSGGVNEWRQLNQPMQAVRAEFYLL
jgi:hydroxyacylglutathione hydrolase